jgi:hypothetical protein
MFQVEVNWLDEQKSRASFSLPGREEWQVEHLNALIEVLAEIRAQMTPAVSEVASALANARKENARQGKPAGR